MFDSICAAAAHLARPAANTPDLSMLRTLLHAKLPFSLSPFLPDYPIVPKLLHINALYPHVPYLLFRLRLVPALYQRSSPVPAANLLHASTVHIQFFASNTLLRYNRSAA